MKWLRETVWPKVCDAAFWYVDALEDRPGACAASVGIGLVIGYVFARVI